VVLINPEDVEAALDEDVDGDSTTAVLET